MKNWEVLVQGPRGASMQFFLLARDRETANEMVRLMYSSVYLRFDIYEVPDYSGPPDPPLTIPL